MAELKKKVGFPEQLIYGSGGAGFNVMYTLFSTYVMFYYTDVVGMNAAIIGVVILVSKIFDGISDLIAGQWVDTHGSKRGHCIPILMRWAVPMLISVVLVFLVPESSVAVRVAFIFVTYNLFNTVVYTLMSAAHTSLASYATDDPQTRSSMLIYGMMFSALTQTIMANVMIPMVEFFGGQYEQSAWVKTVLVFGSIGMIFIFLNVFFVKERIQNPAPPENLLKGIKVAFKNKYWMIALCMSILANVFLMFNMSISVYYLKDVMGNMGLMGPWVAASNLIGIPVALVIPWIMKKGATLRQMAFAGTVIAIAGQIAFIVLPASVPVLLGTGFIKGLGFGFIMGIVNACVAETIDYGEWKTGIRIQGVLMAAAGVGCKIGQGVITSVFGFFLTSVGYDGMLQGQAQGTINGINAFFKYGLLVVMILLLVCSWLYKVEDETEKVRKELVERRGEL